MPDYSIRVFQLNFYIKQYLPDLFIHFKKQQISPDLFFSKWIITIFASYLSFDLLVKVWDIFLIVLIFVFNNVQDKWKAIIKFSLVFLNELRETLLQLDLNETSKFFRNNSKSLHSNHELILFQYNSAFKVTNKQLENLRNEYFLNQLQFKLVDPMSTWESDQVESLNIYFKEKGKLEENLKKELNLLQNKIEEEYKNYFLLKKTYIAYRDEIKIIKDKIEEKIESNHVFNNVMNILQSEVSTINLVSKTLKKNSKKSLEDKKKYEDDKVVKSKNKDELKKIKSKHKKNHKEIEISNKKLYLKVIGFFIKQYKEFDEIKYQIEKSKKIIEINKENLNKLMLDYENDHNDILKQFSEKLKLSEKFVKTSQFQMSLTKQNTLKKGLNK